MIWTVTTADLLLLLFKAVNNNLCLQQVCALWPLCVVATQARIDQILAYPILLRSRYCNMFRWEVLLHTMKKKNLIPRQK